jgi:hypothetical protein
MARHDDAPDLPDMLDTVSHDGLKDLLRDVVRYALQELIKEELTSEIGAAKHERTETRTAQRNGSRDRLVSTPAGDVELRIPKLRKGSFFPELLQPRRRVDRALWAVIMTAYITVTSTRKVDDLVRALGCDSGCRSRPCRGSAPRSTNRSRCSAGGDWTTPTCRTCSSTRPTSRPRSTTRSSPGRS